jgi:hypothetical protein
MYAHPVEEADRAAARYMGDLLDGRANRRPAQAFGDGSPADLAQSVEGWHGQVRMLAAKTRTQRQIRSLVLCVDLVGSRRICAAQVGCLVDPDGSSG